MRVTEIVDYNHVQDRHQAIHARLENWRRWVIVRPHGWQVAPMFRMYQSKPWGGYRMTCLQCCAALVASARPLRRCQEAMLAVIARHPEAPSRVDVLDAIKAINAKD